MTPHATAIKEIKNARGHAKHVALANLWNPMLKEILYYTYNPFLKFHVTNIKMKGHGTAILDMFSFEFLEQLADRTLSGNTARERIVKYLRSLKPEEAEIFTNILKGNQFIGIAAMSINKVMDNYIPTFGVMRAKKLEEHMFRPGMLGSLKLDGLRGYWTGEHILSRNGHIIQGMEHITDLLGPTPLDGELKNPKVHFQTSSGQTRSYNAAPKVEYHVFDIPDTSITQVERYEMLVKYMQDEMDTKAGPIKLVKHIQFKHWEDVVRNFQKALNAGFEGLVLKNPKAFYQEKRSKDWLKLKNNDQEDLPVIGVYEGEDSFEGTLGGVIVRRKNGVEVRVGTGFKLWERHEIWANPEKIVDQIREISFHEETPDGSLRHPVWGERRKDKE